MPKYFEKLEVRDLKLTFLCMIREEAGFNISRKYEANAWRRFWAKIKDKCSVVEHQ